MGTFADNVNGAKDPVKILLLGDTGAGKTGSLVSLLTQGYKLFIIDTDKGIKPLKTLALNPNYPYKALMDKKKIDPFKNVHFESISTDMGLRTVKDGDSVVKILAPKDAKAWSKIVDLLADWTDSETKEKFGPIDSWDQDCVLIVDSFSAMARFCYYFSQQLNGRLGARDEGYTYMRDVNAAQAQLTRFLELISNDRVRCNVIIITHITWIVDDKGYAENPRGNIEKDNGEAQIQKDPKGLPMAIGRAIAPYIGTKFNDSFTVKQTGSGASVRREILTVPMDGVSAKNSSYVKRSYPVSTGLAEIFAAIRGEPEPKDLMDLFKR